MTSAEIRKQYIEFFVQKHGHTFVPSSPVVPHDDPTLLFTNAGMNQFKPIFLGQETRDYSRAVNTQKCIRAGGKHNDLDDVGRSRRHHTFFEMLGNWSFGDYFKRGAIEMAWELLTNVWKLDPTRLHVSCFEGDEKNGVPRDTEAANIWKEVAGIPDDHIHYFGKDNFWEMGDTGPCGPCTEIYYDRTPDKSGGNSVNGDDPRVMEIWNNVFIQYNRNADRSLTTLPSQHVDTGMGFERICQVLQDVDSNYSIDLFNPFWSRLKDLSGHTYGGKFPKTNSVDAVAEAADEGLRKDIAFRVIADHIRCLTFALTDGAVPSNEGRGYVLRRILRRAVRFGRQQLELKEPFLHTLVPIVVEAMGDAFPELKKNPQGVVELVKDEEVSFSRTLDRGLQQFFEAEVEAILAALNQSIQGPITASWDPADMREASFTYAGHDGSGVTISYNRSREIAGAIVLPAADAFKLHDTYGFPIDLTRIMAEERGMTVDVAGYEKLMEEAREKARQGGKGEASSLTTLPPQVLEQLRERGVAPTDDSEKYGYEQLRGKVMAIWDGKELVDSIKTDTELPAALILDRTNFYAEMGGQVGDVGRIVTAGGGSFDVEGTRSVGGYVLHVGRVRNSEVTAGKAASATVGIQRVATQQNHTTTHLANWALREVLGEGVQQKGSLVDPEKLRFDFSHGKALGDDELGRIESLVSAAIERKMPVYAKEVPQEQALKINGLRAVFGEKYPPMVRVVSVGAPVDALISDPENADWRKYSIEFCGGTHLASSEEAEGFAIVAEESVSKGIRRLVAVTGPTAKSANAAAKALDENIERMEQLKDDQLSPSIAALQKAVAAPGLPLRAKRRGQIAIAELQRRQKAFEKSSGGQKAASGGVDAVAIAGDLLTAAVDLGGGKMVVGHIPGATNDGLLSAIDSVRKKTPSVAVMLASASDGKVNFVAAVSDDLIAKGLKAGDWVREAAKVAGGGGGGRPNMAQAGGKDPSKLDEALTTARAYATGAVK
ncbi:MAG TPA: alanine--tRNA ligase [Tepidisphaeraceae bacterium]|jgi:alanyl-tRNA synthetase|nr:alanine--tRNA ligase [Tepidisphaeraceae bacterium]